MILAAWILEVGFLILYYLKKMQFKNVHALYFKSRLNSYFILQKLDNLFLLTLSHTEINE